MGMDLEMGEKATLGGWGVEMKGEGLGGKELEGWRGEAMGGRLEDEGVEGGRAVRCEGERDRERFAEESG